MLPSPSDRQGWMRKQASSVDRWWDPREGVGLPRHHHLDAQGAGGERRRPPRPPWELGLVHPPLCQPWWLRLVKEPQQDVEEDKIQQRGHFGLQGKKRCQNIMSVISGWPPSLPVGQWFVTFFRLLNFGAPNNMYSNIKRNKNLQKWNILRRQLPSQGVDANRNWGFHWNEGGSSNDRWTRNGTRKKYHFSFSQKVLWHLPRTVGILWDWKCQCPRLPHRQVRTSIFFYLTTSNAFFYF